MNVLRVAKAIGLGSWDTLGDWGGEFVWILKGGIKRKIQKIAPVEPYLFRRIQISKKPSPVWENYRDQKPRIIKGRKLNLVQLAGYQGKNIPLDDWPMNEDPAIVDFALDEHHAIRAGVHYDLRFRHPDNGIVLSIALRKGLPELGDKHLGKDVTGGHGGVSMVNPKEIKEGYGAGTTRNLFQGRGAIWKTGDHWKILFHGEGFNLIPTKEGFLISRWRDSPKGGEPVPHLDRPWPSKDLNGDQERLNKLIQDSNIIFERKYDGAQYRLLIQGDGAKLISRKPEIRGGQPTGHGIDKSWNIPQLKLNREVLQKWDGWEFATEVYSETKGSNGTAHGYLTTILNSDPVTSWETQNQFGWARIKLLAPTRTPGRDIKTYQDWMDVRDEIHRDIPWLRIPMTAQTPGSKEKLVNSLRKRGEEGIVAKDKNGPVLGPVHKFKFLQTFDRKFAGFIKSKTGREEVGTALFVTPKGEIVPTQGITLELAEHFGFDGVKELRTEIWAEPERFGLRREGDRLLDLKGETTLVLEGLGEFEETGRIRVPVIKEVHLDK